MHNFAFYMCSIQFKENILVRNQYVMPFTSSTVNVAACLINTKVLKKKSEICSDCNVNIKHIQGCQENIVTVAKPT